jgi:hypothetical protein
MEGFRIDILGFQILHQIMNTNENKLLRLRKSYLDMISVALNMMMVFVLPTI